MTGTWALATPDGRIMVPFASEQDVDDAADSGEWPDELEKVYISS